LEQIAPINGHVQSGTVGVFEQEVFFFAVALIDALASVVTGDAVFGMSD
jgi:hypothetical protein